MKIKFNFDKRELSPIQFQKPSYFLNNCDKEIFDKKNKKNYGQITDIKDVNLFVGANNSGKSRFLRGMFNTEYIFSQIFENESLESLVNSLINHKIFNIKTETSINENLADGLKTDFREFLKKMNITDPPHNLYDKISNYSSRKMHFKDIYEQQIINKLEGLDKGFKDLSFDFCISVIIPILWNISYFC